jgi:signal transduction histidine kinase
VIPSPFPLVQIGAEPSQINDGSIVAACAFCKHAIKNKNECKDHYAAVREKPEGYFQCPFGFTTRSFYFNGELWAITGVIGFPRFNTPPEREKAKNYPGIKVTRDAIDRVRSSFRELEKLRADVIQEAAQVLPQAFHELRKLNGAILQHAEREIRNAETPALLSIRSAAELVRNNYDILEAISNIDAMKVVPLDATINLFDLCYKTTRVLLQRAQARKLYLDVQGVRAIIPGSQKSFPIVPAVLIENAIKFGRLNSTVKINIGANEATARATLEVINESDFPIDPAKCFERGTRYAGAKVEGSGFGLFLAREIVLAHGGTLRCKHFGSDIHMIAELPLETVIEHASGGFSPSYAK